MQMKKNKVLLLSGTVLFSVMGSIEKANSTEIQNEINIINLNIINEEKPVETTNVEENKAPRMDEEDQKVGDLKLDDEIKKHTEELLGGGKNIDIPDDGREYVVVNRLKGLRTEKDIDNELRVAVNMAESGQAAPQFHNENMRDYFEGESVSRAMADVLGLKGVPYVRPGNKDKKLDNQEDVKEEQDESFRIEKSDTNVDVNFQECKLGFIELKKEEEDKKQDEKTELNNEEINNTNNEGNDFNINNEKQEPEVQNNIDLDLESKSKTTNFIQTDEDSNENEQEPTMLREMLQYEGEKENESGIHKIEINDVLENDQDDKTNNRNTNKLETSVEGHGFIGNEQYGKVTGHKVDGRIAAHLRAVNNIIAEKAQSPEHSNVIEQAPQKTWFQKAITTVKSGLSNAWSSVKRVFSFGWDKVKSVFKWK